MTKSNRRLSAAGFTLVELMIVIAILSILANIIIVKTGAGLSKTRDAKRKADIQSIQQALLLYYQDHQKYPDGDGGALAPNGAWCVSNDPSWNFLAAQLAPYLTSLPKDPLSNISGRWSGSDYGYAYFSNVHFYEGDGSACMLLYHLEDPTGIASPGLNMGGSYWNYYPPAITIGLYTSSAQ